MAPNVKSCLPEWKRRGCYVREVKGCSCDRGSIYGTYMVKRAADDPETQIYWNKRADELSRGKETPVSVEELKSILSSCKEISMAWLEVLTEENMVDGMVSPWRNVLALLNLFPDELKSSHSKQLKGIQEMVEALTIKVNESLSTLQKFVEDLKLLKKATGNQTIVLGDSTMDNNETGSSVYDSTAYWTGDSSAFTLPDLPDTSSA